jgi:type II secretory pathway pseudopilin PulG
MMSEVTIMRSEKGTSLIETAVALALLGIIGIAFLGALMTTSNSRLIVDEHISARILAESQMENIKKQTYAFSYDPVPIPADYPGYTAEIDIDNMRNSNIQKITITIQHHGRDIETLESYKVNR